jgi:hypothetical protein
MDDSDQTCCCSASKFREVKRMMPKKCGKPGKRLKLGDIQHIFGSPLGFLHGSAVHGWILPLDNQTSLCRRKLDREGANDPCLGGEDPTSEIVIFYNPIPTTLFSNINARGNFALQPSITLHISDYGTLTVGRKTRRLQLWQHIYATVFGPTSDNYMSHFQQLASFFDRFWKLLQKNK